MNLAKLIVELRYNETPKPFDFRNQIVRVVTGQVGDVSGAASEEVKVHIRERRMFVVAATQRSAVSVELPDTIDFARDNVLKVFKNLNEFMGYNKLLRLGVRTHWIQGATESFDQLLNKFKASFYNNGLRIVSDSSDVGVALDYEDAAGGTKMHYSCGPMRKEQLQAQFLGFEAESLTENLIFVDCDYYSDSVTTYTSELLRDFVCEAIERGQELTIETADILGIQNR